jgi:hypothetical protein
MKASRRVDGTVTQNCTPIHLHHTPAAQAASGRCALIACILGPSTADQLARSSCSRSRRQQPRAGSGRRRKTASESGQGEAGEQVGQHSEQENLKHLLSLRGGIVAKRARRGIPSR